MNRNTIGFIIVFLLALIVCSLVFSLMILPRDVFYWDESHHALYGMWMQRALHYGDFGQYWDTVNRQTLWPPLHSIFLSIFFYMFGVSFISARSLSLLFLFLSALLVYGIPIILDEEKGWRIGILASIFVLISPLILKYAADCMLEPIGMFMFLVSLLAYLWTKKNEQWYTFAVLGLVLGLDVVTKYNYAFHMVGSMILLLLVDIALKLMGNRSKDAVFKVLKGLLTVGLIFILFCGFWFLTPPFPRKIEMLFWSKEVVADTQGAAMNLWQALSFYPLSIMQTYSPAYILGAVILALLVYSVFKLKDENVRILSVPVWMTLIFSLIIKNKMDRLIYIVVPVLFMAGSYLFWQIWDKVPDKYRSLKITAVILLFVLVLLDLPMGFSRYLANIPRGGGENLISVLNYYRENIPQTSSVSSAISAQDLSPYVFYFIFWDWLAPVYTFNDQQNPDFAGVKYFTTLKIEPDSKYAKMQIYDDSLNRWNSVLETNLKRGNLTLLGQKQFRDIGITALIYQRRF